MTKIPHTLNTPIQSRGAARVLAAVLIGLVVALGTWGAETVFARSADNWPANGIELAQLVGLSVVLGLGLLTSLVVLGRLVGYRRRVERAREAELARLAQAALTDSLTGLGNHRSFHEDLRREIARRTRSGSCFSLVMLDLNGLKQLNDSLGHQAGDERIRAVADCLRATMRVTDAAYRTGGDEFIVLLPNERAWGALEFARRLQEETRRHPAGPAVTGGIAESVAFETADTLLRRADLALYDAKRSGRQIVLYADGLAPKPAAHPDEGATRREHRLLATALARAVDAKDVGTRNHCETVSELCVLIGQSLGPRRRPDRAAPACRPAARRRQDRRLRRDPPQARPAERRRGR